MKRVNWVTSRPILVHMFDKWELTVQPLISP